MKEIQSLPLTNNSNQTKGKKQLTEFSKEMKCKFNNLEKESKDQQSPYFSDIRSKKRFPSKKKLKEDSKVSITE